MSHTLVLRRFLLTLGFFVLSLVCAPAQERFDITPLAQLGDPVHAPATLVSASAPMLNDTEQVLFRGDGGLLLISPDELIVVAAPGDVAPDGRLIAAIGDASVNARGQVAFVASLQPSGSALLLMSDGTLTTIALSSSSSPSTFGNPRAPMRSPALNSHGDVAFVDGPRILLYADGVVTELVRLDDPVLNPGGFNFGFDFLRLNDAGQLVFATSAQNSSTSFAALGVFLVADGVVRVIARPGTPTPDGGTLAGATQPWLNSRGDIVFRGSLGAPPFPTSGAIYLFADEALTEIARVGDVVEGVTLSSIGLPMIDATGQVAFSGGSPLAGGGIFLFSDGFSRRLVGRGDVTVEGDTLESPARAWLNARGQLAFDDSTSAGTRVYRLMDEGISRVASRGDVVPATPRIVSASTQAVRSIGKPVFVASIFPGMSGIFDVDGTLRARVGDEAAGGGFIGGFSDVASNVHGAVAFTAGGGLFVSNEASFIEVLRSGAPAPGGGTFSFPEDPSINASGHVAFSASVNAGRSGVFIASDTGIGPVVRVGDPSPDGGQFTAAASPSLNDAGHVAFVGTNASPPFGGNLFISSPEGVRAIVRVGDPAPGGGTFGDFSAPHLNAVGQIAFASFTLVSEEDSSGIFLFSPDEGLRSVMRVGDPAPGGGTFAGVSSLITLDGSGQVAFPNVADEPVRSGAFLFGNGNIEVIAQSGDPAPGGDTFAPTFSPGMDPKLSTDGRILFTGTTTSRGTGVFLASRPTSQLQVRIDIRPAGDANRIDPASNRSVPVAILSSDAFDATTVVLDTVRFGSTGTEAVPTRAVMREVDGDGNVDLVVRFRIQDTGIQCGQASARLTGRTADGRTFAASGAVQTVRCP